MNKQSISINIWYSVLGCLFSFLIFRNVEESLWVFPLAFALLTLIDFLFPGEQQ